MANLGLWLRWSWRDLRARWLQVVVIALIISLGTGVYAGLGGQKTWRINSYDRSYNRLHMHDLHIELTKGSYVPGDDLLAAVESIDGIAAVEARLIVPTLVDASQDGETIMVPGRIVGVDAADGGPDVDSIFVPAGYGRTLTAADSGQYSAVVEYKFADHYDLKPGDSIRISGDVPLDFVGAGHSPEYFQVVPENGTFLGESAFAVLFMPLETMQQLVDREGMVNNLVVLLADGADRDVVQAALESRLAEAFPLTGFEIKTKDDDNVRTILYADAKNDQVTWNMIALLFLIGAAMGAFNLAGRIVEAQRRQIGIGMALGLPRRWIAFRPLLVGAQIAVLGTIFGLVFGLLLSRAFAGLFEGLMPLPYWNAAFYLPGFFMAALLGVLLPFVATLIPVLRAVSVPPIDAIQTGHLVAKGGGFNRVIKYLPVPGKSFARMPFKNILRSPWRSLLTILGISVAIVLLTLFIGLKDTFDATIQQGKDSYTYQGSNRLLVDMDFFYPVETGQIAALKSLPGDAGQPLFEQVSAGLVLGGTLIGGGEKLDVILELHDMNNPIWIPALLEGTITPDEPGIIISEKAALDLGLKVGDSVTLRHPYREGLIAFRLVETKLPVTGIHDNPIRPLSYMDLGGAELMGLTGVANQLMAEPANGVSTGEIKRALFTQPGVTSVQAVSDLIALYDEVMAFFTAALRIVQIVVLVLAFLIAFNSTSINVDQRVREIATMFAFGLPVRTVTRMQVMENVITGSLGTLFGIGIGWIVLNAFLTARVEEQLADFKFTVTLSPATLLVTLLLGVLVVALTPLLSIRTMTRLDMPSTLRVME